MEKEFVPKKTITIQLTLDLQEKLNTILSVSGLTKTKLLEKLIEQEYQSLEEQKNEPKSSV